MGDGQIDGSRRPPLLAVLARCSWDVRGGAWTGGYPLGWKASMGRVELKPRRRRIWRAAMASTGDRASSASLILDGWLVGTLVTCCQLQEWREMEVADWLVATEKDGCV